MVWARGTKDGEDQIERASRASKSCHIILHNEAGRKERKRNMSRLKGFFPSWSMLFIASTDHGILSLWFFSSLVLGRKMVACFLKWEGFQSWLFRPLLPPQWNGAISMHNPKRVKALAPWGWYHSDGSEIVRRFTISLGVYHLSYSGPRELRDYYFFRSERWDSARIYLVERVEREKGQGRGSLVHDAIATRITTRTWMHLCSWI